MNYRRKAVLLAVALLGFHLGICAQSLSLKMQNVSVKKAMAELQAKSGYSFVYIAGDVDTDRIVSVDADQLQEAIKQSNIKQKELAEKLGLTQSTIAHYLRGDIMPALDTFANLCAALDVDASYILCLTDN